MRLGYLLNTYPMTSTTFIRREIRALERRGLSVVRLAVRPDRQGLVDAEDAAERARTEFVLGGSRARLVLSALARLARRPRRAVEALRLALACARRSEAGALLHLVYLIEAAHVARRAQALGLTHLHAHFGTNAATVAMLARVLGGPPYSVTVHGPEEFDRPVALALREKIARAAFVAAVSSFGRAQLWRWAAPGDWGKVQIVPCGIEPSAFATPAPPPPGPVRLLCIGRLAEQKGQLVLIEALARARAARPELTLTLAGDGPMRGALEAAIAARGLGAAVAITGWVDEARVRAELAAHHALVLPSFAEGLPVVLMEAMAAARPVIATWVAGIPELVRPGSDGWLVPAGDAAALAAAMLELAAAPPARLAAMGAAARARALARHDIDAAAERLAALFAGAVSPGG